MADHERVSRETCGRLGAETYRKLGALEALTRKWAAHLNLISRGDLDTDRYRRHVDEALALAALIPKEANRFIDLGSGGGFPALPLAIATGLHVDLVEVDKRKAAFLTTALAELSIPGTVWPVRIEACAVQPAHCVTARALTHLSALLAYAQPLLTPGGTGLFLKGGQVMDEMRLAEKTWTIEAEIMPLSTAGSCVVKVTRLELRRARS